MSTQKLKVSIFFILATVSCAQILTTSQTTPFLVKQDGYPIEEHKVQTSDDYILTMHRIPFSPKLNNSATKRPVAFLMHGIACASSSWVLNGPDSSLAYILSDAGYDVWMGNARGNVYSKEHRSLSPLTQPFWNFTWHEIGIYDIPAMINYALNMTGDDKVHYIGHSQGTTTFFVLNSLSPSFVEERIRSVHLLAPIVFMSNSQSPVLKTLGPVFGQPNPTIEITGSIEFLPSSSAYESFAGEICKDGGIIQPACSNLLFLLVGGASPYLNTTQLPEISAVIPSGSSLNQYLHYAQLYNSGQFRQFDYGAIRNMVVYGSNSPSDYNLGNLNVPTYLYYGENDILANVRDVNRLVDALRGTAGLKGTYRVPLTEWNHIDFLFGMDVENVVYSSVLNDMVNA